MQMARGVGSRLLRRADGLWRSTWSEAHSLEMVVPAKFSHPKTLVSSPSPSPSSLISPYRRRASGSRSFVTARTCLTEARTAAKHSLPSSLLLRCTIFDGAGNPSVVSGTFKKAELCAEHNLEVRDLRAIDSRIPNLVPTILARRGAFLVNILHIRALVKFDKVLLFDIYGSSDTQLQSSFIYNLEHNLRLAHLQRKHPSDATSSSAGKHGTGLHQLSADEDTNLPYEFRALETILSSVLDALRSELGNLQSMISELLDSLDHDIDREKLRLLLQYRRKVSGMLSRTRAVKAAISEVLDDDEDMALMYLTAAAEGQPRTPESLKKEYDQLELLLEASDKQVEEVLSEADNLQTNISSTQEIVELILDNNRNQLLALDLKVSITTLGVGTGALWASIFGMNLRSGLEEDSLAFFGAVGIAFAGSLIVSLLGLRHLRKIRRVGLVNQSERQSLTSWLPFAFLRQRRLSKHDAFERERRMRLQALYGPSRNALPGAPFERDGLAYYKADAEAWSGEQNRRAQGRATSSGSEQPGQSLHQHV